MKARHRKAKIKLTSSDSRSQQRNSPLTENDQTVVLILIKLISNAIF